jgi:hypothetical protein
MSFRAIDKKHPDIAKTVIAGAVTAQDVSTPFRPTYESSMNLRVAIKVTDVTVVGSIDAYLYEYVAGSWVAVTGKTVSITADGTFEMRVVASADATLVPLADQLKVVITTTNAGDEVTVANVLFYG